MEEKKFEHKEFDVGEIFSGKASGTKIIGFESPSQYTPKIDKHYRFHQNGRDVIVWFLMKEPEPLYIFGPTGCGKSSLIRQVASRINYPVFEITGHERLEVSDLIGHLTVKDGNMAFDYGPLSLAMKIGGILLFNEIDLCSPATLAGLNSILDGAPLCIPENNGELVFPTENYKFVATANTNGASDDTGLYQGTLRQNLAFLDRFILVEAGYPSPNIEIDLIKSIFEELPETLIMQMVEYANEIRKLFMGEFTDTASFMKNASTGCEVTLSTRTLIRWANLIIKYKPLSEQGIQPINYALDRALAFRASKESRAMLHELAQRIFSKDLLK